MDLINFTTPDEDQNMEVEAKMAKFVNLIKITPKFGEFNHQIGTTREDDKDRFDHLMVQPTIFDLKYQPTSSQTVEPNRYNREVAVLS